MDKPDDTPQDAIEIEFKQAYADALSYTDIEDPAAARLFAAEEAYNALMDRASDLLMKYSRRSS